MRAARAAATMGRTMNRVLAKDIVPPLSCHGRGGVTAFDRWLTRRPRSRRRAAVRSTREDAERAFEVLTEVMRIRKKSADVTPGSADADVFFTAGTGVLRTLALHTVPVKDSPHRPAPHD